jgi:acetyltransferase-like isoleucine patch superfamily enzyme
MTDKRVDIDPQDTKHKGVAGLYELALRRFKTVVYIATIVPLYIVSAGAIGLALVPGVTLFRNAAEVTANSHPFIHDLSLGMSLAFGYVLYGLSIILIVPAVNFLARTNPTVFRGPYYSVDFLQWYVHNALTYIVRYTFLEFVTPSPINLLFYRMMGMKIGRGTQINTTNISDSALIVMGDKVTIGGSATLCAHYGMDGFLVLAPVIIGNKVTIGLKASVLGGVEIGDGAKILPHSVVLPKTIIPPGETWGGVPAVKIK